MTIKEARKVYEECLTNLNHLTLSGFENWKIISGVMSDIARVTDALEKEYGKYDTDQGNGAVPDTDH